MSVLWILGEAKSGKSELGEAIFAQLPGAKFYIATYLRNPEHMEAIARHVRQRPSAWETIEITDRLDAAVQRIGDSGCKEAAVLLDGWAVYLERKAAQWGRENPGIALGEEHPFTDELYREHCRLVEACRYLVVVDHISPYTPTPVDYEANPIRWRMRAVVSRCIIGAGKVIYHDREDVSHSEAAYVSQVVSEMIALEQAARG